MNGTVLDPFSPEPVPTIPLVDPPLERVILQVRFSPVLAVADATYVSPVQTALAHQYPDTESAVEVGVALRGPSADLIPNSVQVWRFRSSDTAWTVTLTPDFVALETTRYEGSHDFFDRLDELLHIIETHIRPKTVERTGIRYIMRLTAADDLDLLSSYVRPEVLGVVGVPDADPRMCLTQAQFDLDGPTLGARWGLVPPMLATDPGAPAVEVPSWLMDLDVFDEERTAFSPADLARKAFVYSRRQYRFFRWAVEPPLLRRFGGDGELVDQAVAALGAAADG